VSLQVWAALARTNDIKDVWYYALPIYLKELPASAYCMSAKRKYFFDSELFIHCPSARFSGSRDNPKFSLAMNSQLIQLGRCDPVRSSIQISLIENQDPSRIALFIDGRLDGEPKIDPKQEDDPLGQSGAWANRFSQRHTRGGNIAFGDGHASWLLGTKVVETDPNSPLRGGPILPPRDVVWEIY
jgi:prepilin-type processing-associated H-X9-DG protein